VWLCLTRPKGISSNTQACTRRKLARMNILHITPLLVACWGMAFGASAQTTGSTSRTPAKAIKPAASESRIEIRSVAAQIAAGIAAAEAALEPAELAIAERVHTGVMPCELGASVTLSSDPLSPGYFNMQGKNFHFRMIPVSTATGAIRLEDRHAGGVWLQLPNKSMLMNQNDGQRMADGCTSPAQVTMAQAMKDSPPSDLLDAPARASEPVPP
jgi:hypothetical protein